MFVCFLEARCSSADVAPASLWVVVSPVDSAAAAAAARRGGCAAGAKIAAGTPQNAQGALPALE